MCVSRSSLDRSFTADLGTFATEKQLGGVYIVNLISHRQQYRLSLYISTRVVFKIVWLLQGCLNLLYKLSYSILVGWCRQSSNQSCSWGRCNVYRRSCCIAGKSLSLHCYTHFHLQGDFTPAIVIAGVLHSVRLTNGIPYSIIHSLWPRGFIKSCTLNLYAFVRYLWLCCDTSHNKSAIPTIIL